MRLVNYIKGTLQDKNKSSSGREVTVFIFVIVVIASWIGEQFYDKHVPEFMFLGFVGIITAGIGLYTIEKPITDYDNKNNTNPNSNTDENDNEQPDSKTKDNPAHDI
jgi:hypothetical protein